MCNCETRTCGMLRSLGLAFIDRSRQVCFALLSFVIIIHVLWNSWIITSLCGHKICNTYLVYTYSCLYNATIVYACPLGLVIAIDTSIITKNSPRKCLICRIVVLLPFCPACLQSLAYNSSTGVEWKSPVTNSDRIDRLLYWLSECIVEISSRCRLYFR